MTKARDIADNAGQGGGEVANLIINGDMAVSQRGTSQTGITTSQYANAPDRYFLSISNLGTWTASQSTTAPDGFSSSYKLECTTADASPAASDYLLLYQKIEGQNLQVLSSGSANAKKHTLSFWVRSSKTGTYTCEIEHIDGLVYNSIQYTIDTADTWERKSITFDGYQTTPIANDNTVGYFLTWWLGTGTTFSSGTHNSNTWHTTQANRAVGQVNLADSTSNDWYITGVSLVVGDKAPSTHPYESYAENLERCRRYFIKYGSDGLQTYVPVSEMGSTQDNYRTRVQYLFSPEMRAAPAVSYSTLQVNNRGLNSSHTVTRVALAGSEYSRAAISMFFETAVVSGQSTGQPSFARVANSNNGYLYIDAEL